MDKQELSELYVQLDRVSKEYGEFFKYLEYLPDTELPPITTFTDNKTKPYPELPYEPEYRCGSNTTQTTGN